MVPFTQNGIKWQSFIQETQISIRHKKKKRFCCTFKNVCFRLLQFKVVLTRHTFSNHVWIKVHQPLREVLILAVMHARQEGIFSESLVS